MARGLGNLTTFDIPFADVVPYVCVIVIETELVSEFGRYQGRELKRKSYRIRLGFGTMASVLGRLAFCFKRL